MMTIGIIANLDKYAVRKFLPRVIRWLKEKGVDFFVEEGLARKLDMQQNAFPKIRGEDVCEKCQMVISFGGDGTILSSARLVGNSGIPILGVKMGGMGFLAELTPEEVFRSLQDILNGHYEIVERMVLQARFLDQRDGPTYYALNDFVLDKGATSRVIRIKTCIDDEFLNNYIGDGLIISTPTGSTAYSLAAGGPILLPTMDAIIVNPICPHSLGARPVVMPGNKTVLVQAESVEQSIMFSADGQVREELAVGQRIEIKQADYSIKLVSYQGRSFYDVLRAKLNWGEDVRSSSS